MVGTTLREIRTSIEQLASDEGDYYVVCGRSGERPVPVASTRFPTREAATEAARATEQYRAALRRYDPQVPFYDPIVCEGTPDSSPAAASERDGSADRSRSDGRHPQPLIGFCHDVSGAVFEALSERDHPTVESAIMETYLTAAEAVTDPNALCLVLLERMAAELQEQLAADERAAVLRAAAANLSPVASTTDPVEESLEHLHSLSLVSEYGVLRRPIESTRDAGGHAWVVYLRGYAMECRDRRLPTLPIGIDVLRRARAGAARTAQRAGVSFGVSDATALGDDDWRLLVTTDASAEGLGLVCIQGESP